jgi:glucose-6-phosphate 1-epimerase
VLEKLRSTFSIPNSIDFQTGNGGMTKVVVTTPIANGEIYLNGAHVTHYQPVGQVPVLFMSGSSRFENGKAIRGGVPICFPWFGGLEGRDTAPAHGFARTSEWAIKSTRLNPDQSATVVLELSGNEDRSSFWPHAFKAEYVVTIGATLRTELTIVHVRGEPFLFEEAMHSYFHVGDVRQVSVTGLAGCSYLDKLQSDREIVQGDSPIQIVGETDRIYLDTTAECVIDDPSLKRKIFVKKLGSDTTVLWNPWIAKSKAMPDFGDDEWPGMLCIETCNVGPFAVRLGPGQSHTMVAEIHVEASSATIS